MLSDGEDGSLWLLGELANNHDAHSQVAEILLGTQQLSPVGEPMCPGSD